MNTLDRIRKTNTLKKHLKEDLVFYLRASKNFQEGTSERVICDLLACTIENVILAYGEGMKDENATIEELCSLLKRIQSEEDVSTAARG